MPRSPSPKRLTSSVGLGIHLGKPLPELTNVPPEHNQSRLVPRFSLPPETLLGKLKHKHLYSAPRSHSTIMSETGTGDSVIEGSTPMPPPSKGKPPSITIPSLIPSSSDTTTDSLSKPSSAISSLFRWPSTHRQQNSQSQTSEQSLPSVDAEPAKITALESELRSVSSELAHSIRREMDLEDLVLQLQDDVEFALKGGKPQKRQYRTSDYFSDAEWGSPGKGLTRTSLEEKQNQLERRVRELDISSAEDEEIQRLQCMLEDMRRKYAEERNVKEGLEDIIAMNKMQLDALQDERDQLQQDVVPALKERLVVLEQSTQSIRAENELLESRLEKSPSKTLIPVLDTNDRLKEVEAQRDALHQSLRALRERQTLESKKSSTKIQALELELQKLRPFLGTRPFRSSNSSPNMDDDAKRRLSQAFKSKSVLDPSFQSDFTKLRKENTALLEKVRDYDKLLKRNQELEKTLQLHVSESEYGLLDNVGVRGKV